MPIMPPTAAQQPSYPSDRDALWKAVRALEQRLERPAPPAQAKTGVVTTSRPTVRVLGASVDRDVWRINSGATLEVGDEVVCVETALGLVVLSVVEEPPLGPYVAPPVVENPNLIENDECDPSYGGLLMGGWWSDLTDNDPSGTVYVSVSTPEWGSPNAPVFPNPSPGSTSGQPSTAAMFCSASGSWVKVNGVTTWVGYDGPFIVAPVKEGVNPVPVTAGTSYLIRSDTMTDASFRSIGAAWFDAAGSPISTSYGDQYGPPAEFGWLTISATLAAPPGATTCRPFVRYESAWKWNFKTAAFGMWVAP